jgi:hypothetical protein
MLSGQTKELEWQRFFEAHPFVLTETLPLVGYGLSCQVPLLSGVPDFVFYRHGSDAGLIGDYGVIEIKRPDQAVVGSYSTRILVPSRPLRTAQQEVAQHLRALGAVCAAST